ncbi:MAG: DUF5906 domain-containing protein [Paracoccaceae bacterium]
MTRIWIPAQKIEIDSGKKRNYKNDIKGIDIRKIMLPKEKMEFFDFVKRFDENTPCYRHITIGKDESGKKFPQGGDHSDWTPEQIAADRGHGNRKDISWSIKHTDNYFCVDYDFYKPMNLSIHAVSDTILQKSELYQHLQALNPYESKTNKGIHQYIRITGLDYTTYKEQKDVVIGDFAVDLLKKNNIWAPKNRIVEGSDVTVAWEDIKHFFDIEKMNFEGSKAKAKKPKPKPKSKPEPESDDSDSDSDSDSVSDDEEGLKEMLTKIKERHIAGKIKLDRNNWVGIGYALCNHFKGSSEGLDMFDHFSKQFPEYYDYHGLKKTYRGMKKKKQEGNINATLNYIRKLADMGYNEFEEAYNTKGTKAVVKLMNKVCMFNRATAAYIVINNGYEVSHYYIYSKAQAQDYFASNTYCNDAGKPVNPFNAWLTSKHRLDINGIDFDPSGERENIYNLWKGYSINCDDCKNIEDAEAASKPFFDHIYYVWCKGNEAHYQYIKKRLALILQKPGEFSGVNIVVKSGEGGGKSTILEKLREIIGKEHYLATSNPNHIFGNFNGMSEGKKIIVLEEGFFAGDKETANRIKDWTTNDTTVINKKFKDAYDVKKFADLFICTNEDWIINVQGGSRRFFCLELSDKYAGIQTPETKAYFDAIRAVEPKAIAKVLYGVDLTGFNPREFEKTKLMQEQVEMNMNTVQKWWKQCLEKGQILKNHEWDEYNRIYMKDLIHKQYMKQRWGTYDKKLYKDEFFKQLYKLISDEAMGVKLQEGTNTLIFPDVDEPDNKEKYTKSRQYVFIFPDLETCRKVWNKKQQWEYKWLEDEDDSKDEEILCIINSDDED